MAEQEYLAFWDAADYVGVTMVTLTAICKERRIESARVEKGVKLYRKSDFEQVKIELLKQPKQGE